jgi:hypothetical protein
MNDADVNYTKEAFLNTWNLVFLAVAAGVAVGIRLIPEAPDLVFQLTVLLGVGAELMYLGIMPRNERFRRHVRSQKAAEKHKPPSQREIFSQLRDRSQRRYAKLRKLKEEIRANYRRLSYASQGILEGHVQKIDGLLESYLDLLFQRERYRDFMDAATEKQIVKRIDALKSDMADDSERVRAVKKRRLRVLKQRLARFHKAHENLEIIGAQLGTIEDVVKYIHEQSWTMQDPQEVGYQLDALLEEVEETQASIREIEDVFSSPSDYLDRDFDDFESSLDDDLGDLDDLHDLDAELDAEVAQSAPESGDLDVDVDLDEEFDVPDRSQRDEARKRVKE